MGSMMRWAERWFDREESPRAARNEALRFLLLWLGIYVGFIWYLQSVSTRAGSDISAGVMGLFALGAFMSYLSFRFARQDYLRRKLKDRIAALEARLGSLNR